MDPVADERVFTVEEANRLLPELRTSLVRLRDARTTLLRSARRIREVAPADGGGGEAREHHGAMRTLREEVEGMAARGVILRDAQSGLIDFPSRREGRQVFLCWRLDDGDRVSHWHEVHTGFTNRKPL